MTVHYRRCSNGWRVRPQQHAALRVLDAFLGTNDEVTHDEVTYEVTYEVTVCVEEVDEDGNVKALEIDGAVAATLPAEFAVMFPKVERLELSWSCFTDLSPLCGMRKLYQLRLDELWRLRTLPNHICASTSVKKLSFEDCEEFDYASTIPNLYNLEELSICDDEFESLPSEIGFLLKLKKLSISSRRLNNPPPEIGKLELLEYLELHGESIESIPPCIGHLLRLKTLVLTSFSLVEIPETTVQLVNLKEIDLRFNFRISRIPAQLLKFPRLEKLTLSRCDNLSIPKADILECADSLVEFYADEGAEFYQLFRYMTRINRAGRCLLKKKGLPLALWSVVLGRCKEDADSLLFFLVQKPDLVPTCPRKRKAIVIVGQTNQLA